MTPEQELIIEYMYGIWYRTYGEEYRDIGEERLEYLYNLISRKAWQAACEWMEKREKEKSCENCEYSWLNKIMQKEIEEAYYRGRKDVYLTAKTGKLHYNPPRTEQK